MQSGKTKGRLHIIGIFHFIPNVEVSACAFSGRVARFGKMMLPFGYEVYEYSNEGSQGLSTEHITILNSEEFKELRHKYDLQNPNIAANMDSDIYRAFSSKLKDELAKRVQPGDIVCHPYGIAHADVGDLFPQAYHVEVGIGYEQCHFPLRIYESYSWQAWMQGKEKTYANAYQWVCPMGFDTDDWDFKEAQGDYILFFGRLSPSKGLEVVVEIAKHCDRKVVIAGTAGDVKWIEDLKIPNLEIRPAVLGRARSELLGNAYCTVLPTVYCEPFGGVAVESMMTGTPALTSDHGAFSETILHEVTGFRCKTLGDWLDAIGKVKKLNRSYISSYAKSRYGLENVGAQMDRIFKQIKTLNKDGWYSLEPTDAIWR